MPPWSACSSVCYHAVVAAVLRLGCIGSCRLMCCAIAARSAFLARAAGHHLSDFLCVFHILISPLIKRLRFLAIDLQLLSYTPIPWGRRAIPWLRFLYVFHIPVMQLSKKLKFLAIVVDYLCSTPLGQAGRPLSRFLCVFHLPISQLTKG